MYPNDHSLSCKAASYDMNPAGQLSLPALLRYYQQSAHEHANLLDIGFKDLAQKNIYWVLSALFVEIETLPAFDQHFDMLTWPRHIEGLLTCRDAQLIQDQKTAARLTSKWLMVNAANKRLVRPQELLKGVLFSADRHAVKELPPMQLKANYDQNPMEVRSARFSDLDVNRHVNNTRYLEWILDALHQTNWANLDIKTLNLQYSREFKEHDQAHIFFMEDENRVRIDLVHTQGKTGVACEMSF